MPSITFSHTDLNRLVGKSLSEEQLQDYVESAKGEMESLKGDEAKVSFDDTNLPYLWSVEGVARFIRGLLGKEKGIPKFKMSASGKSILVDKSVQTVRPFLAAFIAKDKKVDGAFLKQIIQFQEKFCETYGRKRRKVSIGIYRHKKISFPVSYTAVPPTSIRFTPLDFSVEMNLAEILEVHPKGQEYGHLLEGSKKYPILIDAKQQVLSFPPIINSNTLGKVEVGDSELLVEVTGTDERSVHLAANIFAQAFFDRGFTISSLSIKHPHKRVTTPHFFHESLKISPAMVEALTGIPVSQTGLKTLLERMGYSYSNGTALIPFYRQDILHAVDIIEDAAISYGYKNIQPSPLTSYTIGTPAAIISFVNKARELMLGAGFQEVMSPILSNKAVLYEQMNLADFGTIEIKEYMSESYSVVRTWLLPLLMDILAKNRHEEYPQRIFEQGLITTKAAQDDERIAAVSAHEKANYTEIRQVLDAVLAGLGITASYEETEHSSFIPGRVARVKVRGKKVAYLGEIHPAVLEAFGLEVPVAAYELNLTELHEVIP